MSPADLSVLYEDARVICLDKPAGLPMVPERFENTISLQDLVGRRLGTGRPDIVHRIDKGVSGCVVVAKDREAAREVSRQFRERTVHKVYLALVAGEVLGPGEIDRPIVETRVRGRYAVGHGGEWKNGHYHRGRHGGRPRQSITAYAVAERFRGFTLLTVEPRTGRTHQIRVHLASEGLSLAVDDLYGAAPALFLSDLKRGYRPSRRREEAPLLGRVSLHAHRITFVTPATNAPVTVEAPIPKDLGRALKALRKYRPAGA